MESLFASIRFVRLNYLLRREWRLTSSCHNSFLCYSILFHFISLKKENTMIILRNPQIAELIEAGCA